MNWSQSPWSPWKKWFGWNWGQFSFLNPYYVRRILQDRAREEKQEKDKANKKRVVHVRSPKDDK